MEKRPVDRSFGNLRLTRDQRGPLDSTIQFRCTADQRAKLMQLSEQTGRPMSDILRAAVDLAIMAGERVTVFDRRAEVERLRRPSR